MELPQMTTQDRFRLRVKVYPPEAAEDQNVAVKRSILIARGPSLPLPDLTIRELCDETLKRYAQIYPTEVLFSVKSSQDESGSDLYLGDYVRDVFRDNEVFRIIQGSSMKSSLAPESQVWSAFDTLGQSAQDPKALSDLSRSKKHARAPSKFKQESREHEKRQKISDYDPDQPVSSYESDQSMTSKVVTQCHSQKDVVPETQEDDCQPLRPTANWEPSNEVSGAIPASHASLTTAGNIEHINDASVSIVEDNTLRKPSPSSSTSSGFGDRVFSEEPDQRAGRLLIRPTPKKRLLSQDRARSASSAATTPFVEPVTSITVEIPRSCQKLKRPSRYTSANSRDSSASCIYDEIDETDTDEAVPTTGRQSFVPSNLDSTALLARISTQNWKSPFKASSERSQSSSISQRNEHTEREGLTSAVTAQKNTTMFDKAQEQQVDDASKSLKGLRAKQTAILRARKAVEAERERLANEKASEAQKRAQASARANKEAEARARKNEAEVARLLASENGDLASSRIKEFVDEGQLTDEGNRIEKAPIGYETPKITPIPAPVSAIRISSTPFIPRERPATKERPLKLPAPGHHESVLAVPQHVTSKASVILPPMKKTATVTSAQPAACVTHPPPILPPAKTTTKSKLTSNLVTMVAPVVASYSSSESRSQKSSPILPDQAREVRKPDDKGALVLNPDSQRILHSFSIEINANTSTPAKNQLAPTLNRPDPEMKSDALIDTKGISAALPTDKDIVERLIGQIQAASPTTINVSNRSEASSSGNVELSGEDSSEDDGSSSDSDGSVSSEDDSPSSDDAMDETRRRSDHGPRAATPELLAAQLSSTQTRIVIPNSTKALSAVSSPGPSLKRLCAELRRSNDAGKQKSVDSSRRLTKIKQIHTKAQNCGDEAPLQSLTEGSEVSESSSETSSESESDAHPQSRTPITAVQNRPVTPGPAKVSDNNHGSNDADEMELARQELSVDINDFDVPAETPLSEAASVDRISSSPTLQRKAAKENNKTIVTKKKSLTDWSLVRNHFHAITPRKGRGY